MRSSSSAVGALRRLPSRLDDRLLLEHEGVGERAGQRFDAAQARADAALAGDDEGADLARPAAVRAAAQLLAEAAWLLVVRIGGRWLADADDAHLRLILLAEERHRAARERVVVGLLLPVDVDVLADLLVDQPLHRRQLVRLRRLDVCEVEAQPVGRDERPRLLDVRAEHLAQRRVKQVRGGVVALAGAPVALVDGGGDRIVDGDAASDDGAAMHDQALGGRLCVVDADGRRRRRDLADVTDLAAALGIERSLDQHDLDVVALGRGVLDACRADDRGNGGVVPRRGVANEARADVRQLRIRLDAIRLDVELRGGAAALALRRHLALEACRGRQRSLRVARSPASVRAGSRTCRRAGRNVLRAARRHASSF